MLALALAAVALAKPVHSDLSMKLNKSGTALKGALTSTKASCLRGVEVTLYYKGLAPKTYEAVATAHTNADGTYKIPGPGPDHSIPGGKYYGATEKSGMCPATTSNKVTVPTT